MRNARLLLLTALLLLAGCRKDGFVPYAGEETGQVRNGIIVTDNGVNLVVDANPENYDVSTARRVFVTYKATAAEGDKTYRIDLEELRETSVIDPIPASEPMGLVSDDPVRIDGAWFSGGYLNVDVSFSGTDPLRHRFPASYEVADGKVAFRIWHDAQETTASREPVHRTFLCYPLEALTKDFLDQNPAVAKKKHPSVPVRLQWRWYAQDGDTVRDEVVLYEKEGSYLPAS